MKKFKFSKRTPLMEIKTQHSNYINTICTQGNKEKAIFWAKKAYRNGVKLPDELKILININ